MLVDASVLPFPIKRHYQACIYALSEYVGSLTSFTTTLKLRISLPLSCRLLLKDIGAMFILTFYGALY